MVLESVGMMLRGGFRIYPRSHPTIGLQLKSLSSLHEELNISPERWLRRHSFAQPEQDCMP